MQRHVKRRYDSSTRKQAARLTRHAVLEAARELILTMGYAATTMADIADRAGVALDTVYATAGPKPKLFRLLIEGAISGQDEAVAARDRDYVLAIRNEPSASGKLDIYARAVVQIQNRLAPLFSALQQAAFIDHDLSLLWQEISDRRAANMREFATNLAETGHLAVSEDEAADVLWVMNSPQIYLMFTDDRGWDANRYERWLVSSWKRLLLP